MRIGVVGPTSKACSCRLGTIGRSAPGSGETWHPEFTLCARQAADGVVRKREGDGATPVGCWRLLQVLYRADRIRRPTTGLPARAIGPNDGWCDAPDDRNYNRLVRRPYGASAEFSGARTIYTTSSLCWATTACRACAAAAARFSCTSQDLAMRRPRAASRSGASTCWSCCGRLGAGAVIRVLP